MLNRTELGALTLTLSLAFLGGAASLEPKRDPGKGKETIAAQIAEDVATSLQRQAEAETQADWDASGYTPRDIFTYVHALKTADAWDALCAKFSMMTGEDLAMFEDEIRAPANQGRLACAGEVLDKIENHWNTARIALLHHHTQSNMAACGATEPGSKGRKAVQLPSEEVHVDPAQEPTLSNAGLKEGEIAITLDDGPHPTRTARILEILAGSGIRSNFFEIGQNAQAHPEISKSVVEAGHEVGSHTWSHPNLPTLALNEAEHEIQAGRDAVIAAAGVDLPFFRFPYGAKSAPLLDFVKGKGLASFFWNMDSLDWKLKNPVELFQNVLKELDREKRGIILFHDIHEQTVIVLPHVIEELHSRGFKTVVFVPH